MVGTASAQNGTNGGPTYSGTVTGASDSTGDGNNDTFEIDLDGDGVADQTIEADGKDGTETVRVGYSVSYKLKKLQNKDKNKPREVSEWVNIGAG